MKKIYIFTEFYPFGKGEAFLENEIPILSKYFNKIVIISRLGIGKMRLTPDNVEVISLNNLSTKRYKIEAILRSVFSKKIFNEIINLKKRNILNYTTLKALVRFLYVGNHFFVIIRKKFNFSESIIYSYWFFTHAFTAIELKKIYKNVKVISRCHRYDLYEYRQKYSYLPMRKYLIDNVEKIYCISNDAKYYLQSRYNIKENKLVIARLGTNDYGEQKYIFSEKLRIVSCSWAIPVKRLDRIYDALNRIDSIEIEWTHYGDGISLDELKHKWKIDSTHNIKINFYGEIENNRLMEEYKKNCFDVFLNVSESEGIPVSIMEALSFGIPVIATDVGANQEIVIDKINGFLLHEPFKLDELVNDLLLIKKMERSEYLQFRKNARLSWKQRYFAQDNYDDFVKSLLI